MALYQRWSGRGQWSSRGGAILCVVLAAIAVIPWRVGAQAKPSGQPAPQAGAEAKIWPYGQAPRVTLIEGNDRFHVVRMTFPPGVRTDVPGTTHPDKRDVIIIMATPGDVEVNTTGKVGKLDIATGQKTGGFETGHFEPGKVWWFPAPPYTHAISNVGKKPFEVVVVYVNPPGWKEPQPVPPAAR